MRGAGCQAAEQGGELRILATSRQTLNIAGEQILEVPPLSAPDPDRPAELSALVEYEAVRLFADRTDAVTRAAIAGLQTQPWRVWRPRMSVAMSVR